MVSEKFEVVIIKDESTCFSATFLRQRLGRLDRKQSNVWQQMTPAKRLEMAFQAYQFVLDAVRLTERHNPPELSQEELIWCIVRRMQGRKFQKRSDHGAR